LFDFYNEISLRVTQDVSVTIDGATSVAISYVLRQISDVLRQISDVWSFGHKSDVEWAVVVVFHIFSLSGLKIS